MSTQDRYRLYDQFLEKKLNVSEINMLADWLVYIRNMPRYRVKVMSELMQTDLPNSPIAKKIEKYLEAERKRLAEVTAVGRAI